MCQYQHFSDHHATELLFQLFVIFFDLLQTGSVHMHYLQLNWRRKRREKDMIVINQKSIIYAVCNVLCNGKHIMSKISQFVFFLQA